MSAVPVTPNPAAPSDEDVLRMLGLHPDQLSQGADVVRAAHGDKDGLAAPQPEDQVPLRPMIGQPQGDTVRTAQTATGAMGQPPTPPIKPIQMSRPSMFSAGENRISQAHPFWGGLLKGLDVAGSILAPGATRMIPGTRLNEGARRTDAALQAKNEAGIAKEQAETAEANARAGALQNPQAKTPFDVWRAQHPGEPIDNWLKLEHPDVNGEQLLYDKNGAPIGYRDAQGKFYSPDDLKKATDPNLQAVSRVISGASPTNKPPNQEQNKLDFQKVIGKIDAAGLPTGPKQLDGSIDAALKNNTITKDEHAAVKSYLAANPTPGTNLQVTVAGAQQKQGFEHNEKAEAETYKRYETAQDAEQRLSRMEASYKKALNGDQQAMLALLTDHIGMTLGLQKGARITKDILHEAAASQPWLEKLEAKFDGRGYLSGVTLGKDQMGQMLDLGYEARDRAVQGAHDSSELYGVPPPPGAEKVFGKRTIGEKPALNGGGGQIEEWVRDPVTGKLVKK